MKCKMLWTAVALLGLCVQALAELPDQGRLDVRTSRVVVYKDGYCLLAKEVKGSVARDGRAFIEGVPDTACLGTFWLVPRKGGPLSVTAHQEVVRTKDGSEQRKRLLVRGGPKAAQEGIEATLMYFGPGIRWIPTYRISVGEKDEAELIMQAVILNELEDLADVPLDLVVGVPNFRFKNVVSAMSLVPELKNPLLAAAPHVMGHTAANVLFTQRAGEFRGGVRAPRPAQPGAPGAPAIPAEIQGAEANDLFVYTLPRLSLGIGERAAAGIISTNVPMRHIYTWDVRLSHLGTEAVPGSGPRPAPAKLLKSDVWHQLELTNNTGVPWTTGTALLMRDYLPLGQDLLTYTAVGGKCQVPVTVAIDVRGTYAEEEIERKVKAVHFDGRDYVKITKKGTLRITNYKKEPIALYVTCNFGGNCTRASDDGTITLTEFRGDDWVNHRGHPALNNHSTLFWELKIPAGMSKELTCQYYYFTR